MRAACAVLALAVVQLLHGIGAEPTNVLLRLHKPVSDLRPSTVIWDRFKQRFAADAAKALQLGSDRLTVTTVTEGNEVAPTTTQYGAARRRTSGAAYLGGTLIVQLLITPGTPSNSKVIEKLRTLVADQNSAWYAEGSETKLTDPGFVPTLFKQRNTDPEHILPTGLVVPLGAAPLGFLLLAFLFMVKYSGFVPAKSLAEEEAEIAEREQKEKALPRDNSELKKD